MKKRRGSVVDKNKEGQLLAALQKTAHMKWIRHQDYLNLWIINPNYVPPQSS
jgi:hypothetical protein